MPELIAGPARVEAAGNKPKVIDEFIDFLQALKK